MRLFRLKRIYKKFTLDYYNNGMAKRRFTEAERREKETVEPLEMTLRHHSRLSRYQQEARLAQKRKRILPIVGPSVLRPELLDYYMEESRQYELMMSESQRRKQAKMYFEQILRQRRTNHFDPHPRRGGMFESLRMRLNMEASDSVPPTTSKRYDTSNWSSSGSSLAEDDVDMAPVNGDDEM